MYIYYRYKGHSQTGLSRLMSLYVSGSSKTQTLLPFNVIEISPRGFKFCNFVEKY